MLIFADLHQFNPDDLNKINKDFDIIVFLGDITSDTIKTILRKFPDKEAYGILGNHDSESVFNSVNMILKMEKEFFGDKLLNPVKNINLRPFKVNGVSFTGLQGSVKYKYGQVGYSQEEASGLYIPPTDILFSHDTGFHYITNDDNDVAHQGFEVVSRYIEKEKPKFNIFGHHHKNIIFKRNDTTCICVYGCSIFDFDTGKIYEIF